MTVNSINPLNCNFKKLKLIGKDIARSAHKGAARVKAGGETLKKDLVTLQGGLKELGRDIRRIDWRSGARAMGREFKNQIRESGRGLQETGKAFKQIFYTEMKDYLKECSLGEAAVAGFYTGALFGSLPTVIVCSLTGGPLGWGVLGAAMAAPVVYNGAYRLNRYWKNLGEEKKQAGQ